MLPIKRIAFIAGVLAVMTAMMASGTQKYAIDEQFDSLDNWVPITFPKIEKHSVYEIIHRGDRAILAARSNGSASGIRYSREFSVDDYPVIRWRWKVDNVFVGGNVEEKSGDDYPLRVYVMFKYDPDQASFTERLQYGLAKTLYGAYPPKNSLNYIWANRRHEKRIYPSAYTDRARLIILRAGKEEAGRWVEEEVNIMNDYQQAFGGRPPSTASIAVMNDSDNTGEAAVSYLDYIQVLRLK